MRHVAPSTTRRATDSVAPKINEMPPTSSVACDQAAALHAPQPFRSRALSHLQYPNTSLSQALDQTARRYGRADAVIAGDVRWSYGELHERVNRVASGLSHMGVGPGERVLTTLPNCPEYVVCFFAVQRLGAVVVNAGPLMGADDIDRLIGLTRPRVIIALDLQAPDLETPASKHPRMCWLWVSLQQYQTPLRRLGYRLKQWQAREHLAAPNCQATLEAYLEHSPSVPPTVAPAPNDVAVLQPTGGTTGTLKVAQLTHQCLLTNATQVAAWARLIPAQERIVAVLPMFHAYGLTTSLVAPILYASTILPVTRFKTQAMLNLLREHRPTMFGLVPIVIDKISDSLESKPDPELCDALQRCTLISGAAPLTTSTAQRFEDLTGAYVFQGYGLTEASPVTHCNPLEHRKPDSIGLPLPNTEARLIDLDDPTQDAPAGQLGELLISGPQLMLGYYENPEATANAILVDRNGKRWLRTGDVATVDEEGYFYIVDRKKHMINHAGLKIWPGRVEEVLLRHPDVTDVAVIGRPDPQYTELVVARVVPVAGVEDTTSLGDTLREQCREHLARYEVPSVIEFSDQLPRSALGKMMKHRIDFNAPTDEPAPDTKRR